MEEVSYGGGDVKGLGYIISAVIYILTRLCHVSTTRPTAPHKGFTGNTCDTRPQTSQKSRAETPEAKRPLVEYHCQRVIADR